MDNNPAQNGVSDRLANLGLSLLEGGDEFVAPWNEALKSMALALAAVDAVGVEQLPVASYIRVLGRVGAALAILNEFRGRLLAVTQPNSLDVHLFGQE
jgi:hypothetical protein